MVDLHNVGTFNADTGFKAGYLNELERMLQTVLPNAMLKAKPNIESRIRLLKREWSIVYDMLNGQNNSGFGWDEHRQLVVAEDTVWESYLKSHKEAAQFRFRTFPYYDQLTTIYARDRATGKDAQTAADVLEEIHADDVRTTDMNEERNTFYDCEADVSLTTWMFLVRIREEIGTKGVPHLQTRERRNLMLVIMCFLHLMRLPLCWGTKSRPLVSKSVGVLPPRCLLTPRVRLRCRSRVRGVTDIAFKRPLYFALVNCYSLLVDDNFVVNDGMKNCLLDMLCVEKFVDDVELIQHMQNLDVCAMGYSHAKLDLFDYDGFVEPSNSCAKSSCLSMSSRMKCDRWDYEIVERLNATPNQAEKRPALKVNVNSLEGVKKELEKSLEV
ncbi:hypothetical protein GOBAR_DD29717 [Gossypium barbadense]|nr:hypothetical protein GOBAR_DD29717 [Gossypium barbadense]